MTFRILSVGEYRCEWEDCKAQELDVDGSVMFSATADETEDSHIDDYSWLHIRESDGFHDYCPDHWHKENGKLAIGENRKEHGNE